MSFDLSEMTQKQKTDLLNALLFEQSKKDVEFSADEMAVWTAACDAARKSVGASGQPIKTVVGKDKHISVLDYRRRVEFILEFMNAACDRKLDRTERLVMLDVLFESLARYMRGWMPAITAKTILDCYESIPMAINEDYPMYAECGLLGRLIK